MPNYHLIILALLSRGLTATPLFSGFDSPIINPDGSPNELTATENSNTDGSFRTAPDSTDGSGSPSSSRAWPDTSDMTQSGTTNLASNFWDFNIFEDVPPVNLLDLVPIFSYLCYDTAAQTAYRTTASDGCTGEADELFLLCKPDDVAFDGIGHKIDLKCRANDRDKNGASWLNYTTIHVQATLKERGR